MKKPIIIIGLLIYLFLPSSSFAARSISITSDKSSLFNQEELMLTASISGFTNGEKIYIKGAFFKEGSTNYFGYTKFNDAWVKNSETATSQREVTVGQWDLKTILKSDFEDSGFDEKGLYNLKLGFYYQTSTGLSSVNWSANNLVVNLDAPTPSPTNEPESKSNSISSKSTSYSPTVTLSPKVSLKPTINPIFAKIASEIRSASEYAKFKNSIPEKKTQRTRVLGAKTSLDTTPYWIAAGLLLLVTSAIWLGVKYYNKNRI